MGRAGTNGHIEVHESLILVRIESRPRRCGERPLGAITMSSKITYSLVFLMLTALAPAQESQTPPQHAAATVAHLHDTMLDPTSFVIDSVFITKPNKRGNVSLCYAFRSHNKMGGYSDGRAVEDGDDHNRLSVYTADDGAGRFPGYDVGWFSPCKDRNIRHDLTAEVSSLAPTLYRKSK